MVCNLTFSVYITGFSLLMYFFCSSLCRVIWAGLLAHVSGDGSFMAGGGGMKRGT